MDLLSFIKYGLEILTEVRQFGCCNIPDDRVVNTKVVVDKLVSHSSDLTPLNIRLHRFDIFRKPSRSLRQGAPRRAVSTTISAWIYPTGRRTALSRTIEPLAYPQSSCPGGCSATTRRAFRGRRCRTGISSNCCRPGRRGRTSIWVRGRQQRSLSSSICP